MMIYLALMLGGIGLFIWGLTGRRSLVAIGGFALAAGGVVANVIHKRLLPRQLRKNAPWKLLGQPLGGVHLEGDRFVHLVPVGDGYYKDSTEFRAVNSHLLKEVRQKMETEVIETGAWKAVIKANRPGQG